MPEETVEREVVDIEDVDLSFANNKVVERPFPAEVRIELKEAGNYGPQYHLAVHPLHKADPDIMWHSWTSIPIREGKVAVSGQFGEVYEALRKHAGSKVPTLGNNLLVGEVFMFVFRPYEYFDRRSKTRKRSNRDSLICVGKATQADIDAAFERQSVSTAGTPDAARPAPAGALTPEELQVALGIMAGKKTSQYTKGLMSNESIPQTVRDAVFDGRAKTQILATGLAQDVEGVLVVPEPAVA